MYDRKLDTPRKKEMRYGVKYQTKWETEFPWVKKSQKGIGYALCKTVGKICPSSMMGCDQAWAIGEKENFRTFTKQFKIEQIFTIPVQIHGNLEG